MSLHTHLQLLISGLVVDVRPRTCHWHHPSSPGCLTNSRSAPSVVFVWLLGFVCLLFPDGRHRLHLSSFQVPWEIFTALAEALILFPLVGLYDRPFIHSNWKQLSLPVWAGGGGRAVYGQARFQSLSSEFSNHTLPCFCRLFFQGAMVLEEKTFSGFSSGRWLLACSLLTKLVFTLHEDLTECRLGIIKVCDIMYLQEARRETCPSKCGGGPVNVFTHRMRF